MVPRRENGERDTLGGWHSHVYINTDTTDNPQGPTVEHGNATKHWQVLYGKGTSKRIYVYIHVYIYICGLVSQSWSLSRLGSSWGSWGGWASKGAPLDAECLVPCAWDPDLQIQVGPPPDEPSLPHAKEGELSGLEEL